MKKSQQQEFMFKELNAEIQSRKILNNVSGVVHSGELLAVMGPSGSGKTTLLSAVGGRIALTSGQITVNGIPMTKALRRKMCYVLQDDLFLSNLTLWESLYFAAMVHLPEKLPKGEKLDRVNQIIEVFGLTKCKNSIMGGQFQRGVSGGERKRASIACELLSDPDIMLLDEPTSGLDSSTALALISQMKKYTEEFNKAVVVTIHQPSSQIFHLFNHLLLLADGNIAYFGPTAKTLDFFEEAGLPCNPHYNPADFILEVVKRDEETCQRILYLASEKRKTIDWPEKLRWGEKGAPTIVASESSNSLSNYKKKDYELTDVIASDPETLAVSLAPRWETSFALQTRMLCWRTFKQSKSRILSKYSIATCLIAAIIVGLLWFQIPRTFETVRDRMGLLFFVIIFHAFNPLMDAISSIPSERPVMMKERAAGWYRLSAYYIARMVSEMPLTVLLPTVSITIIYWMAGFRGPGEFFATWGILLLCTLASQGIGVIIGSLFFDMNMAYTSAITVTLCSLLTAGFYNQKIPWWLDWIRYTSFITYPFYAVCRLEIEDLTPIACANVTLKDYPRCADNGTEFITGSMILEDAGMVLPIYVNIIVIAAALLVFRFIGYWITRFRTKIH